MSVSSISFYSPSEHIDIPANDNGVLDSSHLEDHIKLLDLRLLDLVAKSKNSSSISEEVSQFSSQLTHICKIIEANAFQDDDEKEFLIEQLQAAEKLFHSVIYSYEPTRATKSSWSEKLSEISENVSNVIDSYDHYKPERLISDWSPMEGDFKRHVQEELIHGQLRLKSVQKLTVSKFPQPESSSPGAAKSNAMFKERMQKFKFNETNITPKMVNNILKDVSSTSVQRDHSVTVKGYDYLIPHQVYHDIQRLKSVEVNNVIVLARNAPQGNYASILDKTQEELYERVVKYVQEKDPVAKQNIILTLGQGFGAFLDNYKKEFDVTNPVLDEYGSQDETKNLYPHTLHQDGGYSVAITEEGSQVKVKIEYEYKIVRNGDETLATTKAVIALDLFRDELKSGQFTRSSGKLSFEPLVPIKA